LTDVLRLVDGVAPTDAALWETNALLGDAVFETMRSYDGVVFLLEQHLARLEGSAQWAALAAGADLARISAEVQSLARSVQGDAAVRVFLVRRRRMGVMRVVQAEPLALDARPYVEGATACTLPEAPYGTLESSHAKYARYLPRLLAQNEARGRGCDEALLVDANRSVVSASMASAFALVDRTLVTSSVLEGITRAKVVELAADLGLACERRPIAIEEIRTASEVFTTSSLREIVPIVRIDDGTVGTAKPGPITRELHGRLRRAAGSRRPLPWVT
jgi:branched-chain amino acid aminotransferase